MQPVFSVKPYTYCIPVHFSTVRYGTVMAYTWAEKILFNIFLKTIKIFKCFTPK